MDHGRMMLASKFSSDFRLSSITGLNLRHEDYGQGIDDDEVITEKFSTDRDIENYEHLRDLYWWYSKMEVYQSILGGTKLL